MRIKLDEAACTGHGRCYALAPEVYEPDDHGHCIVLHDVVSGALEAAARLGAENCPEEAITLEDD
jgi:ferredoxin